MTAFLDNLKNVKNKSKAQFDQLIHENAQRTVLKELKANEIAPEDITPEEMDELLA
jgi:hypothetical protein